MADLTNMPSVWGDLQAPGAGVAQNQQLLNDQLEQQRKKKIMAAGGMGNDMLTATQQLFGSRTPNSGSV